MRAVGLWGARSSNGGAITLIKDDKDGNDHNDDDDVDDENDDDNNYNARAAPSRNSSDMNDFRYCSCEFSASRATPTHEVEEGALGKITSLGRLGPGKKDPLKSPRLEVKPTAMLTLSRFHARRT